MSAVVVFVAVEPSKAFVEETGAKIRQTKKESGFEPCHAVPPNLH